MKPATLLTTLFLSLVALAHLLRIVFQVPVLVGSIEIPMWTSVIGFIGSGALAVWLWRDRKR